MCSCEETVGNVLSMEVRHALCVCVCVCVCGCECACACVCVCVCEWIEGRAKELSIHVHNEGIVS